MFIVLGMYNFEKVVNIKTERSKKITQPHNGGKTSIEIFVFLPKRENSKI